MKRLLNLSALAIPLLAVTGGCLPTLEEQVGTFAQDFFLQALAAYFL